MPETTRLTVGEFLTRWLESTVKPSLAPGTYTRYEQIIRLHLKPYLGHVRLDKLAPAHVEHLYGEQRQSKVSVRNRELSASCFRPRWATR